MFRYVLLDVVTFCDYVSLRFCYVSWRFVTFRYVLLRFVTVSLRSVTFSLRLVTFGYIWLYSEPVRVSDSLFRYISLLFVIFRYRTLIGDFAWRGSPP